MELATPLRDDSRFSLVRMLGAGGMGVVYEAYDRKRGRVVALKTLRSSDAAAFYNFKKEFRALAGVSHPNLVSLYELVADEHACYFTMELVEGARFVDHVRPARLDVARLRAALGQLAAGVQALHDAGRLHRDLKPANVLVTEEGRVVILDFGLAKDLEPGVDPRTLDEGLHGTLPYMAPEVALDQPATPASDWYAVGVMIFEALTGRLPFEGPPFGVMIQKTQRDAPSPGEFASGLPEDLVALTSSLLARDPRRRPAGPDLLARLGAGGEARRWAPATELLGRELVGRQAETAALEDAFRRSRQGRAVAVYVHGGSGLGKTALLHAFLAERADAVVLAGRCHERERVPYKALDGVVDSLSRYLRRQPAERVAELLPRDVGTLSRLFPALRRVDALAGAARRAAATSDQPALRRRAFAALRELLRRLAESRPLVLFVDDLQWADADGIALLDGLLRPPDPPPLLLIASFRREEIAGRPFLRDLLARAGTDDCRELRVDPLPPDAAAELAAVLLGTGAGKLVRALVREAGGSPFLIEQMAGYVRATDSTLSNAVSLAEMLEHRLRRLPAGADSLLSTLALAAYPLAAAVAYEAAGLTGDERPLIAALCAARLVRTSGSEERVELYHDRLRETFAARLDAERTQAVHRRLADTLLVRGFVPEALFEHFLRAGKAEDAARHACRAAGKASEALAFDQAAWFYERALEHGSFTDRERCELLGERAESLSNAGRPGEAAAVFLEAAREVQGREALLWRRRAAHEYLSGGYFDQGFAVMREVLAALGLRVPPSRAGKLLSLLWQRWRLWRRGLGYELGETADDDALLRLDACRTVASYLATVEPLLGLEFQSRHLRLALDAGDGVRIGRALAIEAMTRGMRGEPARGRCAAMRDEIRVLARRLEAPLLDGLWQLASAMNAVQLGEWRATAEHSDAADAIFTERCAGARWERTYARKLALIALTYLGEVGELRRRVARQLAEAEERGNVRGATDLRTRLALVWLAEDDPLRVHRELDRALAPWEGFHLFHFTAFIARNEADLYIGDAESAYRRLAATWPHMRRSMLPYSQVMRIEALFLRGRTELAAGRRRAAARSARRIRREGTSYGEPLADLLAAGVSGRGERTRLLRRAAYGFERADMRLLAVAARRRLGEQAGDESEIAAADAWMASREIARPERMAAMLAPLSDRYGDGGALG